MKSTIPLTSIDLTPDADSVLKRMGVPGGVLASEEARDLVEEALALFSNCAEPGGLLAELDREAFAELYRGEGKNAVDTPLEHIFPRADALALFALTLGGSVTETLQALTASGNIALAGALDAAASAAADVGGERCERFFSDRLSGRGRQNTHVLAYSPGYCGWHVTGQKRLFRFLEPERIGITLNDRCLMTPLKSISGVLAAGDKHIHAYRPHWDFCDTCAEHSCLSRLKRLKHTALNGESDARG